MVDRLKRMVHIADAWIIRHRWSRVSRRAIIGFLRHNALNNAGSMAYFAILSIFQLLVLGVVVLSFFLGDGKARDFVISQVQSATPLTSDSVSSIIDGIIQSRGGIGLISLVFLVWGALGIFSALNKGIASAFVRSQPRGFVKDKLIGLALIAITGLLGLASIAIGVVTGIVQGMATDVLSRVPGGSFAVGLFGFAAPIVLIFIAFLAVYRLTPNRHVSLAEVWPGALVATLLWIVLQYGFTYYATSVANYDSAFGPISAGISLLVFLYFASVVVLLGAEVARANVLDDEVPYPEPAFTPAAGRGRDAQPVAGEAAQVAYEEAERTDDGRRLPGWSLALGGALAAALVRWIAARVTRKDRLAP
jgi:membrane protein